MRAGLLIAIALAVTASPAFAQPSKGRGPEGRPTSNMSHEERRQLREDVDSARGNYDRREMRRQGRMPPEEREKLRRDVQDANRDLRKR
jgi:hypothetical protein